MKIRTDYVSNSSSSSFIVLTNRNFENVYDFKGETVYLPSDNGCYKFGWEFKDYDSFWDKLNWCAIMLNTIHEFKDRKLEITDDMPPYEKDYVMQKKEWQKRYKKMYDMLKDVCKDKFNLNIEIDFLKMKEDWAYIDHQSDLLEEPKNAEMFDSPEKLYQFLGDPNSYIRGGNDNYDPHEVRKNWD